MTTLLLFMLGLLSAGAGAYTLFKDKPASKDSESASSKSSSGGSSVEPSNVRGDRGKEISVPPSGGSSGSQSGALPAQAGQRPSPGDGPKLAKEDSQKYKEQFPSLRKKPKLDLKNKVDDIIRNNSKFANHRRPLINAEALVDKESYNGALEIYKRTKTRVPDEEIQGKIQENIDQIQNHIESDEEEVYRPDHYDGPPIPLGDLVRAIKDISESLGGTIAQGFSNPISLPLSPLDPGAIPGPPTSLGNLPPGPVSYQIFSPLTPEDKLSLPNPGSLVGDGTSSPSAGGASSPGGGSQGGVSSPGGGDQGGASSPGSGSQGGASSPGGGDQGGASSPGSGSQGGASSPGGGSQGGVSSPGGGSQGGVSSPGSGSQGGVSGQALPQERLEPPSAMDLPEDTFFSKEWERFKDLPLVDRRTGEGRRSGGERRAGSTSNRKDRRQGEDRRKEDLFRLRDEYLKQKEEQKKREKEEEIFEVQESIDYDWPETPTRDDLPPFLAPIVPKIELVPIRLPDPQDKTVRPTEEAQPTTPSQEVRFEPQAVSEAPEKEPVSLELPKIGLPDPEYQKAGDVTPEIPHLAPESTISEEPDEAPEIEVLEGGLEPLGEETEEEAGEGEQQEGGPKEEEPRMIHGILELKPPEVDDAPFLTLTYDFDKIPHAFKLSKNYSIMEYSYYKYKPMLIKAQEFARRKMLKNALNYYRVIKSQNIPPELRKMINRNIKDITEFMEKYLMAKGG